MLAAEKEIVAAAGSGGAQMRHLGEADHVSSRAGEIDGLSLPLPGDHAMKVGGGERVVPAHGAAVVRVVVIGGFARRHEGELRELHGVVAAPRRPRPDASASVCPDRGGSGTSSGSRCRNQSASSSAASASLRRRIWRQRKVPSRGMLLDAAQPGPEIALGDRDGAVGRLVVAEVRFDALGEEMLQAAADEPFLVVGGDDGQDAHAVEHNRAGESPPTTPPP